MNHDAVFYSVIVAVAGATAVAGWLLYVAYRNATKDQADK
jgi:uncharacterized membrane-anchored protein